MKKPLPFDKHIYVTKPFLPPIGEFIEGIEEIWCNHWLTNNGPILQKYEQILAEFLKVKNVSLFNNGTLALQVGLQAMEITGDVITTPFTFVSPINVLYGRNIKPVFVDIEPEYYTIDPALVENAITPNTTAILAVHIFGHPCQLDYLSDIARRYKIALIYDAAHAFGVTIDGDAISHFGDMSMFSFHATKLYHSIEGGLLVFKNSGLKAKLDNLKNHGIINELEVVLPGTNAKMNEFQALMGIIVLKHFNEMIERAKIRDDTYRECLKNVPGIKFPPLLPENISPCYTYQPVEIEQEKFGMSRDDLYEALKKFNIFTRRYCYPLICDYSCYRNIELIDPLKVARKITHRILSLPTYYDLSESDVIYVCDTIKYLQKHKT